MQDFRGAGLADQAGEVPAASAFMRDRRLDGLDRVQLVDRPALLLIGLDEGREHIEAVAFRRAVLRSPQRLDFLERGAWSSTVLIGRMSILPAPRNG